MIPKIIHQLWINPEGREDPRPPEDVLDYCNRWAKLNPEYFHKLWTLEQIFAHLGERLDCRAKAAIEASRFPTMKADIARLILLTEIGGFWADLRLMPLVPIPEDLRRFETVLIEHFTREDLPDPTDVLINGFIGSTPGGRLILTALQLVVENVTRRSSRSVFQSTGPKNLEAALHSCSLTFDDICDKTRILRFTETWDKMWEYRPSTYYAPGRHWSVVEKLEPIFVSSQPVSTDADYIAIPNHIRTLKDINNARGFHPAEAGSEYRWISDREDCEITFSPLVAFNALELHCTVIIDSYPITETAFAVNGQPCCSIVAQVSPGWRRILVGPFKLKDGRNQLAIKPPGFISVKSLNTDSRDQRSLCIGVAWMRPTFYRKP